MLTEHNLKITQDSIIVLFEFFERFEREERLYFVHHAEYLALMRLAGQLEYPTSVNLTENSSKSYKDLLDEARERIAKGFESDFPKLELE